MATEEYYAIEKRLSLVEQELKNVHADVVAHRNEFSVFKEKDFKETRDRWDKQTKSIEDKLEESERRLETKLDEDKKLYFDLEKGFVTWSAFKAWLRDAFSPIKIAVYSIIGMILGAVVTAGLTFLLRKS